MKVYQINFRFVDDQGKPVFEPASGMNVSAEDADEAVQKLKAATETSEDYRQENSIPMDANFDWFYLTERVKVDIE